MDVSGQLFFGLILSTLAGLSTGIGSILSLLIREYKKKYLSFFLGFSAGIMIYVSFTELLSRSINALGFVPANAAFFGGMVVFMLIDNFIPHAYITERIGTQGNNFPFAKTGIVTAVGIAIHNFPEGFTVAVSSLESLSLAVPLAVAIAIHNIPEGIAVSMPIYHATKSRRKAFFLSLATGLTEPIGALIGLTLLLPILSSRLISTMLAFSGGIMVVISFYELLPLCFEQHRGRLAVTGILLGMMVMAGTLVVL